MTARRLAPAFAQIVVLLVMAIPVANAQLADSFAAFAYEKPVKDVVGPQSQSAVNTPLIQMNSVRMHLDQIRLARRLTADDSPKVSLNGQLVPLGRVRAPVSNGADGSSLEGGGGASADKPDSFERWGAFINGNFDIAKQSTVGTQTGFKARTDDVMVGADYRFPGNSVLGASVGYLKADTDLESGAGNQNARGYSFSFYGSYVPTENAYIDGILNFGHNRYDGQRQSATGSFSNNTSGDQWGLAVSVGYAFDRGPLTLTPYGRVEYVDAKVNGFTESGDASNALTVGEQRIKATILTLGGQASYAMSTSWGVLLPYAWLEFQYLAQSDVDNVTTQTAMLGPTTIQAANQDKSFGNFALGLTALFKQGVSAFFNYQQLFGKSNLTDQLYTLGLRLEF
jgi:outer membrane lipase/esterase